MQAADPQFPAEERGKAALLPCSLTMFAVKIVIEKQEIRHSAEQERDVKSREKDAGVMASGPSVVRARLDIAAWAFFAMLFGVIGITSFWFAPARKSTGTAYAGVMLPPPGDMNGPTGSIVKDGETVSIGVLPSYRGSGGAEAMRLLEARLETLQREVVTLRRRVMQMSELGSAQPDLPASSETDSSSLTTGSVGGTHPPLEQPPLSGIDAGKAKPAESRPSAPASSTASSTAASTANAPDGKLNGMEARAISESPHDAGDLPLLDPKAPGLQAAVALPRPDPRKHLRAAVETRPAPETVAAASAGAGKSLSASDISAAMAPAGAAPESPAAALASRNEAMKPKQQPAYPVRVVALPRSASAGNEEPQTTASIPPELAPSENPLSLQDITDALMIRPADPAGRTQGSADRISRSDFAIEIGRYASRSAASDGWDAFQSTHSGKMSGLRALTQPAAASGEDVRLLAGPFANAAAASIACLRLEISQNSCSPAFFSGEPLLDE
jgi:hypothetical protein